MSSTETFDPSKLVEVFANIDGTLVSMARDQLTGSGIEGFIFDEYTSSIGGIGRRALIPMRLMVQAQDAERARECLTDLGFPV
ncbi:MAG: DUF2007 domain-containing protein [Candidatus Binataceae bacterium]